MKTLLCASAIAMSIACPSAFADSLHIQNSSSVATGGYTAGSVDGGGSVQNGGHQFTFSESNTSGYATTNANMTNPALPHGSTYTSTTQQGKGFTAGTGAGGYDYSAGSYAWGQSAANFAAGYTQKFNYGW